MGLLLILDRLTDNPFSRSWPMWILLAGAVGLTFWECRERGYRPKITLWWISVVAITHVVGYIVLRFIPSPRRG